MTVNLEDILPGIREEGLNTDENVDFDGTLNVAGVLTAGGGVVGDVVGAVTGAAPVEVVTTTNVLAATESGKTLILNSATGFVSTLPAPAAGLSFKFLVGATPPTSGNHTIVTNGSANVIKGGITGAEVDSTVDFDTSTADDTISFVANQAVSGDWAEVFSDGTNWYVRGWSAVRAGLTLTQASA